MKFVLLVVSAVLLLTNPLVAKTKGKSRTAVRTNNSLLSDLELIRQSFKANYALAEIKNSLFGWNLDKEINLAKLQVLHDPYIGVKKFQTIVKNLLLTTKDYHVGIIFHSTEGALLPFCIQGAQGKYFFTYIDKSLLPQDFDFPFEVGDQILYFDGVPVGEAVKHLQETELSNNHIATDHAFAEMGLTMRIGSLGIQVPEGLVKIIGCKKDSIDPIECELEWFYIPEKITPPPGRAKYLLPPFQTQKTVAKQSYFLRQFSYPHYEVISSFCVEQDFDVILGTKKSFLPPLGKIFWESKEEDIFHAYLFELPNDKKGGFVRIAKYTPEDLGKAVEEFGSIIEQFQTADVLVIDQVNNPGGILYYVYALLSMLSDKPLDVPKHCLALTQEDLDFAHLYIPLLEEIETDDDARELLKEMYLCLPVDMSTAKDLLTYFQFIVDEWNNGRLLTGPCYLFGLGPLKSHPKIQWTKPILVLVNQLDISGGDFFPAILQDNKRAVILGTRTAGAGGFINVLKYPNLHGIAQINYTGSVAIRNEGALIENEGTTPDIHYTVTQADLQNNYVDYLKKIHLELEKLIK